VCCCLVISDRGDTVVMRINEALIAEEICRFSCSGLEESVLENGDKVTFISTLHGG